MRGWKPWTTQPPAGTPIDWQNPLAQGLLFFVSGANPLLDVAGGRKGVWLGTPYQTRPSSGALSPAYAGAGSVMFQRDTELEPPSAVSVLAFLKRTGSVGSNTKPILKTYNNNATSPYQSYGFNWDFGGSGQDNVQFAINATNAQGTLNSTAVASVVMGVYDGAHMALYQSARLIQSVAQTGTITYDTSANGNLFLSGSSSAAVKGPWVGAEFCSAVWGRGLQIADVTALSRNPWQLYWKRRRAYSIPTSSGAAGAAAITEGSDTTSATGNIAIPGTASITEASDTVAATGGITIPGTASILEGGDIVVASGSLSVAGTAAITEGADVVSGTGAAGAVGTAAILEQSDIAAAAGGITIPGTAAIFETSDIVVGTGAITGPGAAAIVEGSDSVIAQGSGPQPVNPMPNFIGFPINYVIQILAPKGIAPTLSYQFSDPPGTTMGIITAQSPAAGQELKAPVSFTCTGAIALPSVGVRSGNVPALLVGNNDNPGGRSANS